jgi:hypothetical protein
MLLGKWKHNIGKWNIKREKNLKINLVKLVTFYFFISIHATRVCNGSKYVGLIKGFERFCAIMSSLRFFNIWQLFMRIL